MKKEIKKLFTQHFKKQGFRINTQQGEVFIEKRDAIFFIKLRRGYSTDVDNYLVEFGVYIKNPFKLDTPRYKEILIWHSIYQGEFYYGGDYSDVWTELEFNKMLIKADEIAVTWVDKMVEIKPLINHFIWRIENGVRYIEPQHNKENDLMLGKAGLELIELLNRNKNNISFEWVKRYYLYVAILYENLGEMEKAKENIQKYLTHIEPEAFKKKEFDEINYVLKNNFWPKHYE